MSLAFTPIVGLQSFFWTHILILVVSLHIMGLPTGADILHMSFDLVRLTFMFMIYWIEIKRERADGG